MSEYWNPNTGSAVRLPSWLQQWLDERPPTDSYAAKRSEPRRECAVYCDTHCMDDETVTHFHARIFNVNSQGVGLLTRQALIVGQRLLLRPAGDEQATAVTARIVHCTQTVQGYKVGCLFEPE